MDLISDSKKYRTHKRLLVHECHLVWHLSLVKKNPLLPFNCVHKRVNRITRRPHRSKSNLNCFAGWLKYPRDGVAFTKGNP